MYFWNRQRPTLKIMVAIVTNITEDWPKKGYNWHDTGIIFPFLELRKRSF